jgi:hypothetical protein
LEIAPDDEILIVERQFRSTEINGIQADRQADIPLTTRFISPLPMIAPFRLYLQGRHASLGIGWSTKRQAIPVTVA